MTTVGDRQLANQQAGLNWAGGIDPAADHVAAVAALTQAIASIDQNPVAWAVKADARKGLVREIVQHTAALAAANTTFEGANAND